MSYIITLGLVETIFNLVMDRVKMVLVGATTIKRDRVPNEVINELLFFDGTAIDDGVGVGVDDGDGVTVGRYEGATFCRRCCGFLCEKCKKHDEDSIMYLQKLSEVVNELKTRGV